MITRDRRTFETLYQQQQCMASDSWIKFLQQLPHSDFAKTKLNKFINVKLRYPHLCWAKLTLLYI